MKILKTLFFALLFCASGSFAQDIPVDELPIATLDENFFLTLDPESPVSEYYYVDISHLGLTDEEAFQKQCKYFLTANLITPELHFSENYLIVRIHTEYLGGDLDYDKVQTYLNQLTKP